MRRWVWLAIAIAVLVVVLVATDAVPVLVDVVARGQRLTVSTNDINGVTTDSLDSLVAQASAVVGRPVDPTALGLSRVCRSEEGSMGQIAKVAICHVVMNQAAALGWTVLTTIRYHKTSSRDQHFGAQISGRVASGQDSYESDLAAAEYALQQRAAGSDPTGGATNFVDRRAFGVQEGTGSFSELVTSWAGDGKVPGTIPGASDNLVFFWRGSVPDVGVEVTA